MSDYNAIFNDDEGYSSHSYYPSSRRPRFRNVIRRHGCESCFVCCAIGVALIFIGVFVFGDYRQTVLDQDSTDIQSSVSQTRSSIMPYALKGDSKETQCTDSSVSHKPMKSQGATLSCTSDLMKPSETVPTNVNSVRPADVKVIAGMGDSITVGFMSTDFDDDILRESYRGNSFSMGGNETLETHISLANIFRAVNQSLIGYSTNTNKGLNVAVNGMTARDLPRQAEELVKLIENNKSINASQDWKLITLFIGTNDVGALACRPGRPTISPEEYEANIEKSLEILSKNLSRVIVNILAMPPPQWGIEASSIIMTGKRLSCGDESDIKKREELCEAYRKAVYSIEDKKQFERKDFTVVVQRFLEEYDHPVMNAEKQYDPSFYADDLFHLSKYGNAVLGKWLWNSLLEPVGKKTKKADFGDDTIPLSCPDKKVPYIRTIGNS